MNKDCAVARDLMPQVIDQVASDESRAFVENHVAGCAECTQVYADMQGEIRAVENSGNASDAPSFKDAMAQLRKTMGWKRIRTAVVAIVLTLVLVIAGYWGYYQLFINSNGHVMDLDAYDVKLYQSTDGTVYGTTYFLKTYAANGPFLDYEPDRGILYIYWKSTILPIKNDRMILPNPQYGVRMMLDADNTLMLGRYESVLEIRQGTRDGYVTVYRAGDAIPPLDPTVEEHFRIENAYVEQLDDAQQMRQDAEQLHMDAQKEYYDSIEQWEDSQTAAPVK